MVFIPTLRRVDSLPATSCGPCQVDYCRTAGNLSSGFEVDSPGFEAPWMMEMGAFTMRLNPQLA